MKIISILLSLLLLASCSSNTIKQSNMYKEKSLHYLAIYKSCMLYGAEKLQYSHEKPEILVRVAQARCGEPFSQYKIMTSQFFQSFAPHLPNRDMTEEAQSFIQQTKEVIQNKFLSRLLSLRHDGIQDGN